MKEQFNYVKSIAKCKGTQGSQGVINQFKVTMKYFKISKDCASIVTNYVKTRSH